MRQKKLDSTSLANMSFNAFSFGMRCVQRASGKEIFVEDVEELNMLDASENHVRRLNAQEILVPQNGDEFIFPCAARTVKLAGTDSDI